MIPNSTSTTPITHLRGIAALRPLRGHNPVVVVCLDEPAPFEQRRAALAALDATLLVEAEPGPLSARLGRPSVTVCDRFLEVALHSDHATPDEAITIVRWLEMRCEECPQSSVDMAAGYAHGGWR